MFDENDEQKKPRATDPASRAKEKADSIRMHAELAAVFEGTRKFDAEVRPGLDPKIARDIQQTMGRLEKARVPETALLPETSAADAARLLDLPAAKSLSVNDYHVHRRPGEVMIVRWLDGEWVDTFYQRLQAQFDVPLDKDREDERQASEWKKDAATLAYLKALDAVKIDLSERYLRSVIREAKVFVLSTQTADEMNIHHLCEYLMDVPSAEVVGDNSAPPDEATDQDRAWFFKLFALRGRKEGVEQMCFFTYLQKTDGEGW